MGSQRASRQASLLYRWPARWPGGSQERRLPVQDAVHRTTVLLLFVVDLCSLPASLGRSKLPASGSFRFTGLCGCCTGTRVSWRNSGMPTTVLQFLSRVWGISSWGLVPARPLTPFVTLDKPFCKMGVCVRWDEGLQGQLLALPLQDPVMRKGRGSAREPAEWASEALATA